MNGKYLQNVERFKSPEFKKSEMMKRKVNNDMRRQHLSPDTQVGLTSDDLDDDTVHYMRLHIIAHQSDLVRRRMNGFKVGTVIGVPFAENTIKDVTDFTFYHHYVHASLIVFSANGTSITVPTTKPFVIFSTQVETDGFVVGTVIDVPFAENTIRDVIDFTFYHHYVHDITEEEVAFNLARLLDKFN
uniref:Uncharacterized protein n=1 Tax=Tanacetum cinerariifolium TaxID=118510 RepID=A0A6L2KAJ5_TANCI|nr:hypothetical protein [Tanacetum cinerariifolium]